MYKVEMPNMPAITHVEEVEGPRIKICPSVCKLVCSIWFSDVPHQSWRWNLTSQVPKVLQHDNCVLPRLDSGYMAWNAMIALQSASCPANTSGFGCLEMFGAQNSTQLDCKKTTRPLMYTESCLMLSTVYILLNPMISVLYFHKTPS